MRPSFIDNFTKKFRIKAHDTALLIIDMQNATGNRTMGLGKKLALEGNFDSAAYRFDRIERVLIPNISNLAACFRQNKAKVIYITYGANLPDASDVPDHISEIVKATNNIAGQSEHEIVSELQPHDGELILNKTTMGAFRSTGIQSHLTALGIRNVVCVGVSTNNCVAMTAMEACDAQFGVIMVSDATGTDSQEMQEATLHMLQRLWSRVMSTEEVITELTSS